MSAKIVGWGAVATAIVAIVSLLSLPGKVKNDVCEYLINCSSPSLDVQVIQVGFSDGLLSATLDITHSGHLNIRQIALTHWVPDDRPNVNKCTGWCQIGGLPDSAFHYIEVELPTPNAIPVPKKVSVEISAPDLYAIGVPAMGELKSLQSLGKCSVVVVPLAISSDVYDYERKLEFKRVNFVAGYIATQGACPGQPDVLAQDALGKGRTLSLFQQPPGEKWPKFLELLKIHEGPIVKAAPTKM